MALKNSRSTKAMSIKNNKKGSNWFCFRPVEFYPDGSGRVDPVIAYVSTLRKKESIVSPADEGVDMKEDGGDCTGKKGGSRSFSNALKAVNLFEVSMVKKIKKGKSDKKSTKLMSESTRYNYDQVLTNREEFDFGQRIISRSASALATSSSALAIANNSTLCPSCSSSLVTKTTPVNGSKSTQKVDRCDRGYDNYDCGLFLLLLSLLVLVLWGKICAIFCTSTWLFLMPRWMPAKKKKKSSLSSSTLTETNSSESKRKIVREVLLGRDRGSFRCV